MRRDLVITWQRIILWIAGLHLVFLIIWVWKTATNGVALEGDWYFIRDMGRLFLDGQWESIYGVDHAGYFWRFPPYGLYPAAVLAWLPAATAYWTKAALETVATLGALALLRSALPDMRHTDVAAVVVLGSSFFVSTLITGQNSGSLLLIIALGLWLAERHRSSRGFAAWGLLAIKPTLGIGFGLLAVVERRRKGLKAIIGVAALVVATSIPLWRLWPDFVATTLDAEQIRAAYPPYKQVTMLGFLDGMGLPDSVITVVWAAIAIGLIAAAVRIWLSPVPLVRRVGVLVLLLVSANPYMSFYDGLLLAVPGTVWWGTRTTYRDRRLWGAIGACIAVLWIGQHVVVSYLDFFTVAGTGAGDATVAPFSIVGPMVAVWLILEMLDARAHPPTPATRSAHPADRAVVEREEK